MTSFRRLLLIAISTALVGLALLAPSEAAEGAADYRLGPNDRVRITVFGESDLSGEFALDGKGRIAMPLILEVSAQGLTARELEDLLVARLKPDYLKDPKVSVEVLSYRPFYIIGQVQKPGSYPYVTSMTVVNAIALAGGFTYRARKDKILIVRAGDPERIKRSASQDTIIQPGDVVEVPERYF